MAYNEVDLINKAIVIAKKREDMYKNIASMEIENLKVNFVAKVLVRDIKKSIQYYEKIKIEAQKYDAEGIDFVIYDKISFLMNEFQRRFIIPEIKDVKELLEFSVNFEKQVVALFIDIQGRLVINKEDDQKKAYRILSGMIEEKQKHIKNLQMFILENG